MTDAESESHAVEPHRRIVCVGTSPTLQRTMVFDTIDAGDTNRATRVIEYASGKAVNAARVLNAVGQSAIYLGQVGGDRGRFFQRDLDRRGIPHDLVDVESDTRLCVTVVDTQRRQATELIEESLDIEAWVAEELLERLAKHLARGDVGAVVLSGSLAPGVPSDFYARAVRLAGEAKAATVLDARGEPLRAALSQGPTVAKPNRAELAATVGRPVDSRRTMHEAMEALMEKGAQHVVCTRGRDGSSVCGRDAQGTIRFWEVTTPHVEAVNAVGSGDSYAAGLAAGLVSGVGMPDACRYAAACGSANVETLLAGEVDAHRAAQLSADPVVHRVN
jgi:1-phosphofructokinase family hexose kinase